MKPVRHSGMVSARVTESPSAASTSASQIRPPSEVSCGPSKRAVRGTGTGQEQRMVAVADWDTRRLRESGGDDPLVPQRRLVPLHQVVNELFRLAGLAPSAVVPVLPLP